MNKKTTTKSKIATIDLVKQFTSFSDAINNMKENITVISELLDTNEDLPSAEAVYSKVIELAKENMPNFVKRENMLWEFSISGNRVSVKTNKYISFGWNIKSVKTDTDDSSVYQNYYNCRITVFGSNDELVDQLKEDGWAIKDKKGE